MGAVLELRSRSGECRNGRGGRWKRSLGGDDGREVGRDYSML